MYQGTIPIHLYHLGRFPASQMRLNRLLGLYQQGLNLRQAAAGIGVHIATVCRWQQQNPLLKEFLARICEKREPRGPASRPRPQVPWHSQCPLCKARVVVRSTRQCVRFWRCRRWPRCPWASWGPRHPRNCHCCKGPRFWSHSRQSIVCGACGTRTQTP